MRHAAAGDREAMDGLLMRAQEAAYRFGLLTCGNAADAEDVMQEALLKTYRHVHRVRHPEAFRTWLFRTVRNACLMKRRRRQGEPRHHVSVEQGNNGDGSPLEVEDQAMAPDQAAVNTWLGERLRSALQSLPPALRVVVLLREIEGLSTREAAAVMGISEDNVKTRLHRARAQLRRTLGDL